MNIQYQYFKITKKCPWWKASQAECQRSRDWFTAVGEVHKRICAEVGLTPEGFTYQDSGSRGRNDVQYVGPAFDKPLEDPRKHGLKKGQSTGQYYLRADRLGKRLQAIADECTTTPFVEFLPVSKEFPFGEDFISTNRGLIIYKPRAHHSQKGPKRTVVVFGCDAEKSLVPPGLPDGLVHVAFQDAVDWLNRKTSTEKATS